jgi:hypothetical protein
MKVLGIALVFSGLMAGCSTGVRDIDLMGKQFDVSYNVDSTRGLDSMRTITLLNSKTILSFIEGGQGIVHRQTGTISKDSSFNWKMEEDGRVALNDQYYTIEKQVKGFKLKSDSAMLIFLQLP